MEWIRLDVGFPRHPKVGAFARGVGVKRDAAALAILRLLCWAAVTCEDGDLSRVHPDDVAEATELHADPARVVEALIAAGWLDRDGDRLAIHGWAERQSPLLAGRERVRRFRERRREERDGNATSNAPCNVTDTLPVTPSSRYGNGPLPTYRPTDLPNYITTRPSDASAEADKPPSAPHPEGDPRSPVYATVGKGARPWQPTTADVDGWIAAYPGLDVPGELRRAAAWLDASPERRKTVRGMAKFLVSWLGRAQDRAPRATAAQDGPQTSRPTDAASATPRGSRRRTGGNPDLSLGARRTEEPTTPEAIAQLLSGHARLAETGQADRLGSYVGLAVRCLDEHDWSAHPLYPRIKGLICSAETSLARAEAAAAEARDAELARRGCSREAM